MDPAVFGYIRVSQAEGASGLATQRRIFTDVASGRNMRRPAWKQLREKLQPGDVVVVPRMDRLARNLTEGLRTIEELHAQGIYIRALAEGLDTGDGSPTARLMLHMLPSLAEWERETIRDRIRAGVRPRRLRGPDRRQTSGAGRREAAGRPGLPGRRRVGQRSLPDLRGEPSHREGRSRTGHTWHNTTRPDAAGGPPLTPMPYNRPTLFSPRSRNAMTSRPIRKTPAIRSAEKFPEFPPRDDMQNSLHLDQPAHQATLRQHFGSYGHHHRPERNPSAKDPRAVGRPPHPGPAHRLRRGPGVRSRAERLLHPRPG